MMFQILLDGVEPRVNCAFNLLSSIFHFLDLGLYVSVVFTYLLSHVFSAFPPKRLVFIMN